MSGKGSRPRPFSIPISEYNDRLDAIFGKKPPKERYVPPPLPDELKEDKMQVRVKDNGDDFGTCGCGRSPNGKCIGWHGLTEEQYQAKLAEYIAEKEGE